MMPGMDTALTEKSERITRKEAARLAGVSYNGIRNWERTGRLDTVREKHGGIETVMLLRDQVEGIMAERQDKAGSDKDSSVEAQLLREERDHLRTELERMQTRYDTLLAKVLELTGRITQP